MVHDVQYAQGDRPIYRVYCVDDDAEGQTITLLPSVDLGLRSADAKLWDGFGASIPTDPRGFAAYLQTVSWTTATASDAQLFQAPFRAGIELDPFQLVPLQRALELPRVNLMIADDVGLGKTVEAGLIMAEMSLRKRLDFILICVPPAMTLQWHEEMWSKFGIRATIMDADHFADIRLDRGYDYNPWRSDRVFILPHSLVARETYTKGLKALLGSMRAKSMLVLDEAHHAAPSFGGTAHSDQKADTQITTAVRNLARRFEHRLFLSATPHNGHSQSFSALMEILDPVRFTRGVRVTPADHDAVLVRRLKSDLSEISPSSTSFPRRVVEAVVIEGRTQDLPELALGSAFASFVNALPLANRPGRFSLIGLQKRLLSSVAAFADTLSMPSQQTRSKIWDKLEPEQADALADIGARARALAVRPDARSRHLSDWIARNLRDSSGDWKGRKLLVFTEYRPTQDWLEKQLLQDLKLDRADGRIALFNGNTDPDERERLKARFNGDPDADPLRIIIATDAAREGINLQHRCHDLFHIDLPWNPSRLEQRNGRIDRRLQPSPVVTCRYFVYADRPADRIMERLVTKTQTIALELGKSGEVLSPADSALSDAYLTGRSRLAMEDDLHSLNARALSELDGDEVRRRRRLQRETQAITRRLEESRRHKNVCAAELRRVTLEALDRLGEALWREGPDGTFALETEHDEFQKQNWQVLFDDLRARPRDKGEDILEWRASAPLKRFAFSAIKTADGRLDLGVEHLHLEHPLVKRLLGQFAARSFRSRIERTAVLLSDEEQARAVMLVRITLYAKGAQALHSELVPLSARPTQDGISLYAPEGRTDKQVLEALTEAIKRADEADPETRAHYRARARADAAKFRDKAGERAETIAESQRAELRAAGERQAASMERLIRERIDAITATLAGPPEQMLLNLEEMPEMRARQADTLRKRIAELEEQLAREPDTIRAAFEIEAQRIEPIGLVYLLPRGEAATAKISKGEA